MQSPSVHSFSNFRQPHLFMHTQLEGDEGPSVALKHTLEAAIVDFFNRNATSHAHGDKYLPYQLFEPASEDYRCVLDWLNSCFTHLKVENMSE